MGPLPYALLDCSCCPARAPLAPAPAGPPSAVWALMRSPPLHPTTWRYTFSLQLTVHRCCSAAAMQCDVLTSWPLPASAPTSGPVPGRHEAIVNRLPKE